MVLRIDILARRRFLIDLFTHSTASPARGSMQRLINEI
jgi:hypothetical protein